MRITTTITIYVKFKNMDMNRQKIFFMEQFKEPLDKTL